MIPDWEHNYFGWLLNLNFLYKSYIGHPGFLRFRAQDSFHFFSASTGYALCLCHKRFSCVHHTSKRDCQCTLLYLKNYSNLLLKYNPSKENFLFEEYDKGDGAYIQREKKLKYRITWKHTMDHHPFIAHLIKLKTKNITLLINRLKFLRRRDPLKTHKTHWLKEIQMKTNEKCLWGVGGPQ